MIRSRRIDRSARQVLLLCGILTAALLYIGCAPSGNQRAVELAAATIDDTGTVTAASLNGEVLRCKLTPFGVKSMPTELSTATHIDILDDVSRIAISGTIHRSPTAPDQLYATVSMQEDGRDAIAIPLPSDRLVKWIDSSHVIAARVAGDERDIEFVLFQWNDGKLVGSFRIDSGVLANHTLHAAARTSNGTMLLHMSDRKSDVGSVLLMLDMDSGQILRSAVSAVRPIGTRTLELSGNREYAVVHDTDRIEMWDIRRLLKHATLPWKGGINTAAVSNDGRRIVYGADQIQVHYIDTGKTLLSTPIVPIKAPRNDVAFAELLEARMQLLIAVHFCETDREVVGVTGDGRIIRWEYGHGAIRKVWEHRF